jgi:hypothetical protein
MNKNKKTFKKQKSFNFEQIYILNKNSHNKKRIYGKNKIMDKNDKKIGSCNVHVMPTTISDNDITALFNGLLNVVKKKFELDSQAQVINYNISIEKLQTELKNKINECNRLKNEIIFLKSKLEEKNK